MLMVKFVVKSIILLSVDIDILDARQSRARVEPETGAWPPWQPCSSHARSPCPVLGRAR